LGYRHETRSRPNQMDVYRLAKKKLVVGFSGRNLRTISKIMVPLES
jgi:hypothetical protein